MTRSRLALLLAVLSLVAFVTALLLVHMVGHQTLQGSREDPADPDAVAESTQERIECTSPASGTQLTDQGSRISSQIKDEPAIGEDDVFALRGRGIDLTDVSDACGRLRTERLAHAVELGFLGLLLGGLSYGVRRGRTWDPIDRTPTIDRRDDGAVL